MRLTLCINAYSQMEGEEDEQGHLTLTRSSDSIVKLLSHFTERQENHIHKTLVSGQLFSLGPELKKALICEQHSLYRNLSSFLINKNYSEILTTECPEYSGGAPGVPTERLAVEFTSSTAIKNNNIKQGQFQINT